MTDPLLDAVAAISDKSPAIKRFAGMAAARIIALEAAPPTPEPPPPADASRGGIGRQSLGAPIPAGTAGRYDVVMTDEPNVAAALAQSPRAARTLVYMAACDVHESLNYGVDYATAKANGWLLVNAVGVPLRNFGYPANYIGDVGHDGYREAWFDHVSSLLGARQPSGVYVDDVLGDPQLLIGGGYPAKYPTREAWQAAMAGFVQYVGDRLRALGWYVMVNATAFTPNDPASNTPANDVVWWQLIGRHVSALQREYWQQDPGNVDQVFTSDTAKGWLGQWAAWQALPGVARALGCDFHALSYGSAATLDYIRASFLLTWDGHAGAVIAASATTPLNTLVLGQPLGAAVNTNDVWTREFDHGRVTVGTRTGTALITASGVSGAA